MPRKSDEVEALAKVLWAVYEKQMGSEGWGCVKWSAFPTSQKRFRAMACAAIAHLSKKRGAKRGK